LLFVRVEGEVLTSVATLWHVQKQENLRIIYEKFSLVGQQPQRYCQKIFIQNGLEIKCNL